MALDPVYREMVEEEADFGPLRSRVSDRRDSHG